MRTRAQPALLCQTAVQILTYHFRGLLMESSASSFRRRGRGFLFGLVALFVVTSASAQQPANGSGAAPQAKTGDAAKDSPDQTAMVKLGVGDLIEVSVYNVPELATKARVGNSGDVYLPLIDHVHVEGLTQEEAQTLTEKRLADGGFVRNPHVTIFVDEAAS